MAINHTLAPGFLVASPKLDGSVFDRAVIIMVHHDREGAMGFILNKPIDVDFGTLLEMVDVSENKIADSCYEQDVFFGGPVRVEQLWVIHNSPDHIFADSDDEVLFHPQWHLSSDAGSIKVLAEKAEHKFRPLMGYAGWGPGQLEDEIGEGSWLVLDFDERFIDTSVDEMWDFALTKLGIDETTFLMMGKAGQA